MAVTSDAPSYLGLAPGVRRAALNSYDSPQLQRDQLLTEVRAGCPHEDLRDWLQLVDEWERRMDSVVPVPPEIVASGPITENVLEGDAVDIWKFPTPKWHEEDGGRYIGTGDNVITRDPEDGSLNVGT